MSKDRKRSEQAARKLRHSFSDKLEPRFVQKPLPETNLQPTTPTFPAEQLIDIREERVKEEERRKQIIFNLKVEIEEDLEFYETWGQLVHGSKTKIVDGKQVPWTSEDFMQDTIEAVWMAKQEDHTQRKILTRDLTFAFDMQSRQFGNPEDPENGETTEVIDACATILGNVLRSSEQLYEYYLELPHRSEARIQV